MSKEKALCGLCGEPMPENEQMFKYHGYSGDCPKPPLLKTDTSAPCNRDAVIEECIAKVQKVGNFENHKFDDLTDNFGKPRFYFQRDILHELKALKASPPVPDPTGEQTEIVDFYEIKRLLTHAEHLALNCAEFEEGMKELRHLYGFVNDCRACLAKLDATQPTSEQPTTTQGREG